MSTKKKKEIQSTVQIPSIDATPDEISYCAYLIWEQEGRPHGRDVVHWLQAEVHIREGRKKDSSKAQVAAKATTKV
jgi:hypothetical protein